uniref:PSP1 C-terminal domain-containing protein n=1 Tax=Globisporangium ultimum (strain ATCC 200006 / CBS 805.95 / DAOM BR144) TaxID=431595 RepID=K3WUJ4_GLOUD
MERSAEKKNEMQRARHMSLDYLGHATKNGHREDWSEFLSAGMAALSTTGDDMNDDAIEEINDDDELVFAQHQQDVMDAAVAVATSPRGGRSAQHANGGTARPEIKIDTFGLEPLQTDEYMMLGRHEKQRGDSISESLTSSTGSSPSGAAAWRPLGRRMTPQSSSSGAAPPPPPPPMTSSGNQLEHLNFDMPPFGATASVSSNNLKHTSSFRDVVSTLVSSSEGSSLYESSSSSDEEPQDPLSSSGKQRGVIDDRMHFSNRMMLRKGSEPVMSMRPRPTLDLDTSYAEACLPVLNSLPAHPRSLSIDNSFVTSTSSSLAHHAKSPVLGNRKDSQTWQLQDEEFLKTSPRFGTLRGASDLGMFSSALDDVSNQIHEDEPRSRFTKDMRASSVDFTFSSHQNEVNPPLPPPQEPLQQRLRAKSFSYSSVYGASAGFANPAYPPAPNSGTTSKTTYPTHVQHHHHQPQPPTLRDYHGGMRSYVGSPPPVSSPPPSGGGIRPPRVNIPADSPMHQYHQYGPPQPPQYRRYSSDTFTAMPPYPEMFSPEQENHARHSNNNVGRGIRSYSMETSSHHFVSTRPFRSQSMEGPQLFAAGPPLEYPSMTRTNSAGYDWPRGPMDANNSAPPLPPDARGMSTMTNSVHSMHFPSPPPEAYYEVEFKRGRQEIFAGNATYNPGEYVKVEADRGEDIGRIVQRSTDLAKLQGGNGGSGTHASEPTSPRDDGMSVRAKRHDAPVKKIIAIATQRDCELLSEQRKEEHEVFEVCKSKVRQRLLPMNVIDAEYQFDRHKLTFFFEADRRIDFRELVRDLFAIYKTRIWLQQVVPGGGKKVLVDYES